MQRLTDAAIRAAKPGPQTTYHWDRELRGFGYRVTKTGVKTFVVLLGSGKRHTIGRYGLIDLKQARDEAKRLLAERTLGKTQTPRITHSRAVSDFLEDCRTRLRPKSVQSYVESLKLIDFGSQSLESITTQQVTRKLQGLTPSQKEHAIRVGKTYFTWCMRHGLIEKSPLALMQNRLQPSRERVLSDTELSAVYRTALQGHTPFHKIVALLVLTGQRRGEIAAMRWEWISEEEQTITFPAIITKNKRSHTIPYGNLIREVIGSIARHHGSPYCFPAARERAGDCGMKVLIACEFSGTVRRAFRERGHDAWSCDLLPADDASEYHIQGDAIEAATRITGWDLMIAHPPCTYLSVSGMHWTARGLRDPKLTEDALEFVRRLMAAPIERTAIENPVSIISSRIRKPDQIVQPWMFGDNASKATCLWLKNLRPLAPTQIVEPRIINGKKRWGNQTDSGQNKLAPSADRWKKRSETFAGIADAMAEQWGMT